MTRHRRIAGFVAIALLAFAAITMRSQSSSTARTVAPGMMPATELAVDINSSAPANFRDPSPVYSTSR